MPARSRRSAGRPVFGRPAVAVVALIVTFAVGAPAAAAGESPDPTDSAPDAAQAPPPEPVVPDVQPPETDPPPVDPPETETAPVTPPPVDPPRVDPPAAPAPSEPVTPAPGPSPPAETPSTPAATNSQPVRDHMPSASTSPRDSEGTEEDDLEGNAQAVAENVNRVIQAVWQVQQGCRTHCYGTSQTQTSVQWSETTQSATAVSGGSTAGESTAAARNESSTIQFVWQMQIGCVAFCFDTSQTQEASQHASTDQEAVARSALTAWATNLATTVQYVFQSQQGCEHECHGASQSQWVGQTHSTTQSATATSTPPDDGGGGFTVPDWLIAFARNIGATIQTIYQYQEALCLEQCTGDAQLQEAEQRAGTTQQAVAMAPPPEVPPVEQPPAEAPADPGPALAAETPAAPSTGELVAAPIDRAAFVVIRSRERRTQRRQELVFRLSRPAASGGSTRPTGAVVAATSRAGSSPDAVPTTAAATDRRASNGSGTVAGKTAEERPARTLMVPLDPRAGSSNWPAILLLAGALGFVIGFYRKELAQRLRRI